MSHTMVAIMQAALPCCTATEILWNKNGVHLCTCVILAKQPTMFFTRLIAHSPQMPDDLSTLYIKKSSAPAPPAPACDSHESTGPIFMRFFFQHASSYFRISDKARFFNFALSVGRFGKNWLFLLHKTPRQGIDLQPDLYMSDNK